jgi:magnesium-protoporphyrin O-methyltransferase
VAACCVPPGYDTVFGERQARKDARRYRRRGLGKAARRLVELARADGTVLEVGGGVGAIQIELLEGGATHATNVELSSGYEEEARQLLREHGLEDRAERRIEDFVAAGEAVEAADVVVMHRVVCCYPEPDKLVGAAAEHARRRVVLSFPPRNPATRLLVGAFNLWWSVRKVDFRSYVHPHGEILEPARRQGLEVVERGRVGMWCYATLERFSG